MDSIEDKVKFLNKFYSKHSFVNKKFFSKVLFTEALRYKVRKSIYGYAETQSTKSDEELAV